MGWKLFTLIAWAEGLCWWA